MTTLTYGCGFNNLTNQILLAMPMIWQRNVHANVKDLDLRLCTVHARDVVPDIHNIET